MNLLDVEYTDVDNISSKLINYTQYSFPIDLQLRQAMEAPEEHSWPRYE